MRVTLIRHFATKGNLEKRYVGSTDENILLHCHNAQYPDCDVVFSSPLKRCIQTCKKIYSDKKIVVEENLRETNFGDFEYKNNGDLEHDKYYIEWIKSNATMPFPNGEGRIAFGERSVIAFKKCIKIAEENNLENISFIIHGGSIMAILSYYLNREFYSFHVKNGGGYVCEYKKNKLEIVGEIDE